MVCASKRVYVPHSAVRIFTNAHEYFCLCQRMKDFMFAWTMRALHHHAHRLLAFLCADCTDMMTPAFSSAIDLWIL
jgi:hypothetical protein